MAIDLCIYAENSLDSFIGAWAVHNSFPAVLLDKGKSVKPPPDCTDKHVMLIGVNYTRGTILDMMYKSKTLVIINPEFQYDHASLESGKGTIILADYSRSNAMCSWDFLNPGEVVPTLIKYVQLLRNNEYVAYAYGYMEQVKNIGNNLEALDAIAWLDPDSEEFSSFTSKGQSIYDQTR